ncbi:MAG: hypothetical protein IKZ38_00140 [Clostridia bacterium]|nr:hypothetical protein [Clostridia bacterium]
MAGFCLTVSEYLSNVSSEVIFVFGLALGVVAFIVNLILLLAKSNYGAKKRIWLYLVFTAVWSAQRSAGLKDGANLLSGYMTGFFILLSLPSVIIPPRQPKTKKRARKIELALDGLPFSFLGEQNNRPNYQPQPIKESWEDNLKPERVFCESNSYEQDPKPVTKEELDFSHVKNVISRLDNFNLSLADKKQVKELEIAIKQAEIGVAPTDVRCKINDGLGALLKIMSKYGV